METIRNRTNWQAATVAELVCAAQDGDRAAQGVLVTRFEGVVYATAMRRLHSHAEAEELSQEVFVQALSKLSQLRCPEAFGGWVRSITTRMAINRLLRRRPSISAQPELIEATHAHEVTPLELALKSERRAEVHAGLGRLGELDRKTLVAFYFNGKSLAEMSDEHSAPVGTIKRRLHVARKRLADQLQSSTAI